MGVKIISMTNNGDLCVREAPSTLHCVPTLDLLWRNLMEFPLDSYDPRGPQLKIEYLRGLHIIPTGFEINSPRGCIPARFGARIDHIWDMEN